MSEIVWPSSFLTISNGQQINTKELFLKTSETLHQAIQKHHEKNSNFPRSYKWIKIGKQKRRINTLDLRIKLKQERIFSKMLSRHFVRGWPSASGFLLRVRPPAAGRALRFNSSTYFQGQYSEDGRREYFYYVDHQGMVRYTRIGKNKTTVNVIFVLFLGGGGQQLFLTETKMKNFTSCFKDKHFLRFFFRWIKIENETPLTCIPRSKFEFFAAAWGSTTAGGTFPISPSSPTADQRGTLSGATTHRSSSQTSFKVSGKTMNFFEKKSFVFAYSSVNCVLQGSSQDDL